ncbi:MAG TPA: hypothetical protein VM164_02000 [Burkholderiales bacterium]|nr:hypothetical protein [Burkholderiales bacterium]
MMREAGTVVFASLAMNQAAFYERVGGEMEKAGYRIVHVAFHERSCDWLGRLGCTVYNPYAMQPPDADALDLGDYGITDAALLLSHEKAAYELRDTTALMRKLKGHLFAMARVFDEVAAIAHGAPIYLVQELGGFTSVLAGYYSARVRRIDSYFLEPSFFKGRVFMTRNRLAAPEISRGAQTQVREEVRGYLARALAEQSVVIPKKDAHHYRNAARKIADRRNASRLVQKAWDKYVLGKREEFEHVAGHVGRHVRMFLNNLRLRRSYRSLESVGRCVYYPLHVPADFALTIRAPEYLDQCALIDYLCRVVPHTHAVLVKEHPALIGAVPHWRLRDLLDRHDNLVLLHPGINNYQVLGKTDAIVTVNSKSGAEALLLGKPVLALGDSFYRTSPHVTRVDALADLPCALRSAIDRPARVDSSDIAAYFQEVWDSSYAGELYEASEPNVTAFALSLEVALTRAPASA